MKPNSSFFSLMEEYMHPVHFSELMMQVDFDQSEFYSEILSGLHLRSAGRDASKLVESSPNFLPLFF